MEQIRQLVRTAIIFVLLWQLALALLLVVVSVPLSHVLTSDGITAAILSGYLWRVPLSYGAMGVCMILVSACNAMGMPRLALVMSALRLLVCYLPLLWLGSMLDGLNGLLLGAMAGNLLAGLMSWHLYRSWCIKAGPAFGRAAAKAGF